MLNENAAVNIFRVSKMLCTPMVMQKTYYLNFKLQVAGDNKLYKFIKIPVQPFI